MEIRHPAVAGSFYPGSAPELRAAVRRHIAAASAAAPLPKAIIAPHAGYQYSGPIAGSAYAAVARARDIIRRVVLIGPSHRVRFSGVALPGAEAFSTPLGDVPVDQDAVQRVSVLPQVIVLDRAHAREHSLEVHLPFLQETLGKFSVVPLVTGDATASEVGEVLERLWGGGETLIVVSSDLSHYLDYATASRIDAATAVAIEALREHDIADDQACGCVAISGLLWAARRHNLRAYMLDLRSSGDTAGPRDSVVGYGAFAFA